MKTIIRFIVVATFAMAIPAAAQNMDWNMAGSAGNVDETAANAGLYAFTGTNAHFRGANVGQIVLRYPVTNTYGSFGSTIPPWTTMELAAIDNGANGFVVARLVQVDRCSSVETTLGTVTSADGEAGVVNCALVNVAGIDFGNFIYYIEVTLARNAAAAQASVQSLALY
jgi:hypothetical protein